MDTHIVCRLYEGKTEKLTQQAVNSIEAGRVLISPFVMLELQYLYEINRITEPSDVVITELNYDIGLELSDISLKQIIEKACSRTWTRDPFDRLITAEVLVSEKAFLVTKDSLIRKNCKQTVWE
ncbi:MAG: hypothetical protein R2941_08405 [Desulfobacterales bacterium]